MHWDYLKLFIITCKISSWSCWVFFWIFSNFSCFSFSSDVHSWTEFVGSPSQRISFFSFEIIFIAINTFKASYTLRRIFFWSYCWKVKFSELHFYCVNPYWESTPFYSFSTYHYNDVRTWLSAEPCIPAANSSTSSSATSLYDVNPLVLTFSQTFIEKCRRPFPTLSACLRRFVVL